MNQFEITTAQNVTIKLTIANMGDRIIAALIDLFILGGYIILVSYIDLKYFDKQVTHQYGYYYSFYLILALYLPVYFYSLLFEYFMDGQTPGKRIRKIKVVRMDGESLTFGNCLIRWIFRLVDIWFDAGTVAIVAATFSRIHQRLGDMIAGTIVTSTHRHMDIDLMQYGTDDASGYVHFPQVESLKLTDIEVINEALRLYYEKDNFDYILPVSAQLKKAMDILPDMDDLTFVKRVITDFHLLHTLPLI